jgi:uncharacterized membrane protein YphA (DoxX/SURF4 family)
MVGSSLIAQGVGYVDGSSDSLAAWGLAALTFAGAAFLLVGLMTPLVAVLVAAGGIGMALSNLFDSYPAIINLIALPLAIALLGPGAFSLDARMFGRREINIPSTTSAHIRK